MNQKSRTVSISVPVVESREDKLRLFSQLLRILAYCVAIMWAISVVLQLRDGFLVLNFLSGTVGSAVQFLTCYALAELIPLLLDVNDKIPATQKE